MVQKPKVSVVVPAYNAEAVLGEALESIFAQSYTDYEVIVIDDCSTDRTYAIAKDLSKRDKRVKAYRNDRNIGVGATRSRGVLLAKGDYICWQDADDISVKNRIEKQVSYLNRYSQVGVVGGFIEFFDEKDNRSVR